MKAYTWLILFLIVLFGAFLRFYQLDQNPPGLNQDETAIGYNAYSILKTGRDEHGVSWPLYFKSFNDYKLPVYIYMTAFLEMLFGVNAFVVRLPSAFFGSLTVLTIFFLVKNISGNMKLALLTAFLLAINPWSIFFSRTALEVNVAVSFLVLGSVLFQYGIFKKNIGLFLLSFLFFGLSMYTYNVTRLLSPSIVLLLVYTYRAQFFSLSRKVLVVLGVSAVLISLPFLLTFTHSGLKYQQSVLIFGGTSKADMIEMRSYVIGLPKLFGLLFFNSGVLLFFQYAKNVTSALSTLFFFSTTGKDVGDIGVGNMGMFYPIEFYFIITGIIAICMQHKKSFYFFIYWATLVILLISISIDIPAGTRSFALVIPFTFFSSYGLYTIFSFASRQKLQWKWVLYIVPIAGLVYGFIFFQTSYYTRFHTLYVVWWRQQDKNLALYLQKQGTKYQHIVFDKNVNIAYTSILFYQKYPPAQYQKEAIYEPDQLFTHVISFGKYTFRKIDWSKDLSMRDTLFVTEPGNTPPGVMPTKVFYYPTRPVVVSYETTIAQYPYRQPIFAIITTK